MGRNRYGSVLRQIRALFDVGTIGGLTDGQLLERFTTGTGEAAELAFAALVEWHGPMVLRILSLMKGVMTAMFMTKMKFAVLACGLITTGAVVVAQQVRNLPEADARPSTSGATETRAAPSALQDDSITADIALGRELAQLDLDLLAEEVQQLREQVEFRFRDKFRAELQNSGGSDTGRGTQPKELKETQSA